MGQGGDRKAPLVASAEAKPSATKQGIQLSPYALQKKPRKSMKKESNYFFAPFFLPSSTTTVFSTRFADVRSVCATIGFAFAPSGP